MRVALIGGSGFVGGYLVDALLAADHLPSLLVRPGSEAKVLRAEQCKLVAGSLSDPKAIEEVVNDCDAVIYNVGILRESPRQGVTFEDTQLHGVVSVANAALEARVQRFLLMSANGIEPPITLYQETKYRAEQHVRQSGLAYTIFRPSVIFGDPRGRMEIATQLCHDMIRPPFPAVGFHTGLKPATGRIMMSPVHIKDVADAFVSALDTPATVNQTYTLGGPQELSWTEMLQRIAQAVGKRKIILPMPIAVMKISATVFDWIPAFPVTRDQLTMLAAGNTAPDDELRVLINREPVPFSTESLNYLGPSR